MANSTEARVEASTDAAARALESFTKAVSEDVSESLSPSRSTSQNENCESVKHSPVVDNPANAIEEDLDALNISGEEDECRTDEESLSGDGEEKQKNDKTPGGETDASKRLQVTDRDEGASTDIESLTDVEEMEPDYQPARDISASKPKLVKRQITLLSEETLVDTASVVASETDEETFLLQEPKNPPNHLNLPKAFVHKSSGGQRRLGQRLGHQRQRSSSQPSTPLREEGSLSPRSIMSNRECLHNLSSHVTAVFCSLDSYPAARPLGKIKKSGRANERPQARTSSRVDKKTYYLYNATDRERVLRTLLVEDNSGRTASPSGTVKTMTDTLATDVGDLNLDSEDEASGAGTDTEEIPMDLPVSVLEG